MLKSPLSVRPAFSRLRTAALLAGGALALGFGMAQDSSSPSQPPTEMQRRAGSIHGQVLLSDQKTPVSEIDVHVMSGGLGASRTTSMGEFKFDHVPPGRYGLVLSPWSGYVADDEIVQVRPGEAVRDVRILARLPGTISGRILNGEGAPLAGITVSAIRAATGDRRHLPDRGMAGVCMSDDRGEYLLEGLKSGEYLLLAQPQTRRVNSHVPVGQARDFDSKVTKSAVPTFYPSSSERAGAIPVSVADGGSLTGHDIIMDDQSTFCIQSTIRTIETIPFTSVSARLSRNFYLGGSILADGEVNANSNFSICGLGPGSYALVASDSAGGMSAIREFTIADRSEMLEPLTLQKYAPLCGRIRDGSQQKATEPTPIKAVLRLNDAIGRPALKGETLSTKSDPDGSFCFPSVSRDARYWLSVRPEEGFYTQSASYEGEDVLRNSFTPESGTLQIVVANQGATISIRVVSAGGTPVPGTRVILAVDPLQPDYRDGDLTIAVCDQNGQAEIRGVRPGRYRAVTLRTRDVDPGNAYSLLISSMQKGVTIEAKADSTHSVLLHID